MIDKENRVKSSTRNLCHVAIRTAATSGDMDTPMDVVKVWNKNSRSISHHKLIEGSCIPQEGDQIRPPVKGPAAKGRLETVYVADSLCPDPCGLWIPCVSESMPNSPLLDSELCTNRIFH